MTSEAVALTVELTVLVPDPVTTPRKVEVSCGQTFVTLRQVMGRADEWTVYEGDANDNRSMGLVNKVTDAPTTRTCAELFGFAEQLVRERERERLLTIALRERLQTLATPWPPLE